MKRIRKSQHSISSKHGRLRKRYISITRKPSERKLRKSVTQVVEFDASKRHMPTSKVRKELARYLALANLKMPDADDFEKEPESPSLKDHLSDPRSGSDELAEYDRAVQIVQNAKMLAECGAKRREFAKALVKGLSEKLKVAPETIFSQYSVSSALELYEVRHAVRLSLQKIVGALSGQKDGGQRFAEWQVPIVIGLTVGPDGNIGASVPAWGQFQKILENADGTRIRKCSINDDQCEGYFYAIRSNQTACSLRCARVQRTRRWRGNQDKYEYNRKLKSAGVKPAKEK